MIYYNVNIPPTYTISKFHQYCSKVTKNDKYLNGSCPICHEGKSFGKKRRLYYFLKDDYLYCQNCSTSFNPYYWIKEVTRMSWKEIRDEIIEFTDGDIDFVEIPNYTEESKVWEIPVLPKECVNISDVNQLKFYMDNWVVKKAIHYLRNRRLDRAINSPKTYYICLNDPFHKNRIVIPYYDNNGKIINYTSRTFLENDRRIKYLLKFNTQKSVFNLDKIDSNYPYVFICEGPIDSMFIKNGIAISGIHLTENQEEELNGVHPFHKKIWIFDNYRKEEDVVRGKIIEKMKDDQMVFLYDGEFEDFKDINEYCVAKKQDFLDPALILESCYSGQKGLLKL